MQTAQERVRRAARPGTEPKAAPARARHALGDVRRAAGNVAFGRLLQRYSVHTGRRWSDSDLFVTNDKADEQLGIADKAAKPVLPGASWSPSGPPAVKDARYKGANRTEVPVYRLDYAAPPNKPVHVPQDCITTAELVAAWLNKADLTKLGIVDVEPKVAEADERTPVGPGDILFHLHSANKGDFHAAAVIATDGRDLVTMEADASPGAIGAGPPQFDMYEGHPGFRQSQLPKSEGEMERTYVIHFNVGRRADESVWRSIQDEMKKKKAFAVAGKEAAKSIKDSIDTVLAAPKPAGTH